MAASYQAKDSLVLGRQLKVQRLVIPFSVTSSATPASKVLSVDEQSVLYLQTEGLTQVSTESGALDSGEATPSYTLSASDSGGNFNMLVRIKEAIDKVQHAIVVSRTDGSLHPCYVNSPATSANGDKILLNCNSTVNFATTSFDACLIVEYIVQE